MSGHVEVSKDMNAPAERVWAMISDVTRMGEWSPENQGAVWLKGATGAAPGAKFEGQNQFGKSKWKTAATVVDCEPGKRFSFSVVAGPFKIADWAYTFEPTATGCRVTESWDDRRNGLAKFMAKFVVKGVPDRAEHNRTGMEQTLAALATAAEATA
jgi:ligand-binding SRPBCC domain-containing protein